MDTDWRDRYRFRSQHPESDAEKMIVDGDRVTRLSRTIDPADASGEFTGVLKMTSKGAKLLLDFYDDLRASVGLDGDFTDGRPFRMAYLIHLLDRMVQAGVEVNCVPVAGDYHEIDTLQDYELAKGRLAEVRRWLTISFPRPSSAPCPAPDTSRTLSKLRQPASPGPDFQRMMDSAVPYVAQMQELAGVDVISDGEWRRKSYIGIIADVCSGFELGVREVNGERQTLALGDLRDRGG